MVDPLTILLREVARLRDEDGSTERSYYYPLQNFLKAQNDELELPDINPVAEESAGDEVGFPDITVRREGRIIGWIEVKSPDDEDLNHRKFNKQFTKYKDNLENIIFTNFRRWQLWQHNGKNQPVMVDEVVVDLDRPTLSKQREKLDVLLERFFTDYHTRQTATTNDLAIALARKTKLLSQQVQENFAEFEELKNDFSEVLIEDLDDNQFANLIAETLTYSLLLAMLESPKGQSDKLTLANVANSLPSNIPILADLYDLFRRVARDIQAIGESTDAVLDELKHADLENIHSELARHKPNEDPVINFYAPFLDKYDPETKRTRGVYYTPKPVVDFIVDSVDSLLQDEKKFNKPGGLANNTVSLLDPATGTGTFLMSAIQKVYERTQAAHKDYGDKVTKVKWQETVKNHILNNFYGFELMVAPYAIAHLKLTLKLKDLGFRFERGSKMRLQVLLANALDNPNVLNTPNASDDQKAPRQQRALAVFPSIPQESKKAQEVKNNTPILAIIGNPPYANFGRMNRQPWILDLSKTYKDGLGEKNIRSLDDDYIKFIRFAQWKLEAHGQGIFAMITANSFLDGITHRRMRESLLNTFDEIYIYNLHGNARKGEVCPDGSPDQNVFNIMTGVSINIFVKLPGNKGQPCVVRSADAWGSRADKFELLGRDFNDVVWDKINYREFNEAFLSTEWSKSLGKLNFFVPQDSADIVEEYGDYWGVQNIFQKYVSGIKTERDSVTIHFSEKTLRETLKDFRTLPEETIREQYHLPKDNQGWQIRNAKKDVTENSDDDRLICDIAYRPFDTRKIWYSGRGGGFVSRPRAFLKHMREDNIGMIATRQFASHKFFVMFCCNGLVEISSQPFAPNAIFPLYLYPEDGNQLGTSVCQPNINPDFISAMSARLGAATLTPEAVFYYAYAVFHCPVYRERYAELLKIDFPRLPLISDKSLFDKLVAHGNRLVNLHLLGKNPFDDDASAVFNGMAKWGIQFAGESPTDVAPGQIINPRHSPGDARVYINDGEYFTGIDTATWEFMIGGYQVLRKWLRDRENAGRILPAASDRDDDTNDAKHYIKIAVALRETQKTTAELAALIPTFPIV